VRDEDLVGGEPPDNAKVVRRVLAGEPGPHRDIVVLNAAAGLVVGGRAADLAEGIALASTTIDSGAAAEALDRFVAASREAAELGSR
jgi:anthranilate phosphoribosyltransferase